METELWRYLLTVLSLIGTAIYHWKAYRFSISILEGSEKREDRKKAGVFVPAAISVVLTGAVLFSQLPMLILFLIIFLMILLEYLSVFKGRLVTFVFTSGIFMFHIMNVHQMFYGIFSLFYKIHGAKAFRDSGLFPLLIFVVLLVLIVFLELFTQMVDKEKIQLLLKNIGQLYFVTVSHTIINLYLCMLAVCYSIDYLSGLMSLFFLLTSILLFGAFYTAFNHAVRMSILMEYKMKSKNLELQLVKSSEDISQLKSYVYLDPLTEVPNRRYGLEKLNSLLGEKAAFCICFIDLDRLKYVNDVFGHSEGDKYILCVVRSLLRVFGDVTLCRMGGDEFMLLLPDSKKSAVEEMMREADRKMKETASQLKIGFEPSVSYGVMEIEADTIFGAPEILDMADRKMYEQKQVKKSRRREL